MNDTAIEKTQENTAATADADAPSLKPAGTLRAVSTVMKLELTERVRSKKWIAAMIVWVAVVVIMWIGSRTVIGGAPLDASPDNLSFHLQAGRWAFSLLLIFTLGVALLISPALSSTSINGARDTANLAILQATPITAGQLLWGKLLAAWIAGVVFVLVGAIPLTLITILYSLGWQVFIKSLLIMFAEVFMVCALGIGFSALISRPVASVLVTYVVVTALVIGGPLGFLFTLNSVTKPWEYETMSLNYEGSENIWDKYPEEERYPGLNIEPGWKCTREHSMQTATLTGKTWWMLMSSPITILADGAAGKQLRGANPAGFDSALSVISLGITQSRYQRDDIDQMLKTVTDVKPPRISIYDECYLKGAEIVPIYVDTEAANRKLSQDNWQDYAGTSWYWGLGFHAVLTLGALVTAWRRLRLPVKRLPRGVRIA